MSFKEVIQTKKFWPSVFWLMLGFIVIYNLFKFGASNDFDLSDFYEENFAGMRFIRFLLANLLSGFLYGFIVVFLQFRFRLKRQRENH